MDDLRLVLAREILSTGKVRSAAEGHWMVLSQSRTKKFYSVTLKPPACNCPDFEAWEIPCKHIYAVRLFTNKPAEEPSEYEKPIPRRTYKQNWPMYNLAQINERTHFEVLLKDLCSPLKHRGTAKGRPKLPLADVIYAATTKIYSEKSGRRASTDIRECNSKGFIDCTPHHNSISRYLRNPELTPLLTRLIERSAVPLSEVEADFAIDSTGFSTCTYVRWFDKKWGKETKKQRWVKCHAMVGTRTNVVTAVKVTEGSAADTVQYIDLISATSKQFKVKHLTADKAYLSRLNIIATEGIGAVPFIPFKSDSRPNDSPAWTRMWMKFWTNRDEFLKHYHKRSNVETTFSMVKRKFGGAVRSKIFESQVNEVLCKILAHNIVVLIHESYELGISAEFLNDN